MKKLFIVSLTALVIGGTAFTYASATNTSNTNAKSVLSKNSAAYQGTRGCGHGFGGGGMRMRGANSLSDTYQNLMTKMHENRQDVFNLTTKYKDSKTLIASSEFKKLQADLINIKKAMVDERVKLGLITKADGNEEKAVIEKNINSCDGTQIGTGRGRGVRRGMGSGSGCGMGSGCGTGRMIGNSQE